MALLTTTGIFGLTASVVGALGTAYGAVKTPAYSVSQLKFVINGKAVSVAKALYHQGMPYIPIWYLMKNLESLSVVSKWDGKELRFWPSPSVPVDLSAIKSSTGKQVLAVNDTTVAHTTGISYRVPGTPSSSEYMPLSVLQNVLSRLGIEVSWDGTTLTLTTNVNMFTSYAKSGTKLGAFQSEEDAKASLLKSPGGIVKNSQGSVIYSEPDYAEFQSPTSSPTEYTSLSNAEKAIGDNSLGYVVDLETQSVVKYPQNYYYIDNGGNFVSTLDGQMGSTKPSFAKPKAIYVALDSMAGQSPYLSQFYELSESGNHYLGTFAGDFENPFRTVDLRSPAPNSVTASVINKWLTDNNSPLAGLGSSYIAAQNTYGVNAVYLVGHSIIESAWGRSSIAQNKNNLFGYGAYDSSPGSDAGMFPSEEYAILFQAWEVRNNYLDPGASLFFNSPTLDGMNQNYATDHDWSSSIAAKMDELVQQTGGKTASYTQFTPANVVAAPVSTKEPAFYLNGATGTAEQNQFYTNVPLFSNWRVGDDQLFNRPLQNGDFGSDVATMQKALNANGQNIADDGDFGPMTEKALKSYQTNKGIQATGICDFATWQSLNAAPITSFLSANTKVQVDQIVQGMLGGLVTPWYHVVEGNLSGWVDAKEVKFTNVYRVFAASGFDVQIYGSDQKNVIDTIHTGDFVVVNNSTPVNGFIQVQIAAQTDGTPITGYIKASDIMMTQQF